MQRNLDRLDAAAGAGDAALFFGIARGLLQELLAARWTLTAAAITSDEIRARLGVEGEEIRELFLLSEESRYGHRAPIEWDYPRWIRFVRRQLSGAPL